MGLLSSGGCSEEEANHPWVKNPLKMEVKSVLDPCEDDNEGLQDDMSDDEMQNNDYYDTDSEVDHTQGQGDQYIVAPIEKQQEQEDNGKIGEDLFDNNKMASDLNSGLSKKTNVFGLKAWVLMGIVVGLFIIIILVVL